ncbi:MULTISPECIES: gamma-mobile-trio protein GmtX [unclassified Agarivorans]|uniref:gamma-mobile-trio protein GmtX n=1 Tax=unclassified Agarivorans TaxID=2636026 RepID=UPI0026E48DAB|nr:MULTISPECIES: gamma-mobile-trio protein GmtX [unclassified Agarivorans]MDO6686634.1 gamma-mobile-trio protein GmtX [Agarivorans sp. 3_MG-2023]MDO6717731.1 gamma-mobile-trio protein GmtX [Agarivorans sp. 2_MG-2023]
MSNELMPQNIIAKSDSAEPEQVFEQLLTSCKSKRSRASLTTINDICKELAKGTQNFRVNNVGKISALNDGPTCAAIRNKNGHRYQLLIDAYRKKYSHTHTTSPTEASSSKRGKWITAISDPGVRAQARIMMNELRRLERYNSLLIQQAEKPTMVFHADIDSQEFLADAPLASLGQQPRVQLTTQELRAVSNAIDPEHLKPLGLHIGERGELNDETNRKIFGNGFIDALKKLLASQN